MPRTSPVVVDIASWVEKARHQPHSYLERQAIEIFLNAIGTNSPYGECLFLKGGTLMGIVYQSPRQTVDLDFSTNLRPDIDLLDNIGEWLDGAFPLAAARLGNPDLICKVQSIKHKPRASTFTKDRFPAVEMKIAYGTRVTIGETKRLP